VVTSSHRLRALLSSEEPPRTSHQHALLTSVARQNLESASSLITKTLEYLSKSADPNSHICDVCEDERAIIYSTNSGNITSNAMADDWVVGVIRWLFSLILDMNVAFSLRHKSAMAKLSYLCFDQPAAS
jgi:hypothetical protein